MFKINTNHTRSAANGNLFIPKLSSERTKIFQIQRSTCLECLSVDAREYSLEKLKKNVAFIFCCVF